MSSTYELIGPVLPQALRLARYQASASLPKNVKELQSENNTINQTPSREEERLLASNASVMSALEDLFSWGEKDSTCRTSKLSRMESVRFQRAMYRIWLISVLFGPRRFDSRPSLANKIPHRKSDLAKSWKDQKTFLRQFSTQELFQIYRLAMFLISIAEWSINAEWCDPGVKRQKYNQDGIFLFAGPHVILRCYEDETTRHLPTAYLDDDQDGPYAKFLTRAFSEIIQERQVTTPIGYVGVILDDIHWHGKHYRCHHCDYDDQRSMDRMLPALWSKTNWEDLKGRLNLDDIVPGNLSFNLVEKPLIQALNGDWSRLLHEMFDCRSDEYAQWSKEDWFCNDCWFDFIHDTMWRWHRAQRKKAGELINKNCEDGYDCEDQCHESGFAHAKQFNHLCEPVEEPPETSETSSLMGSNDG